MKNKPAETLTTKLLIFIGVVQGWSLWALWKAREQKIWPAIDMISERGLLYLIFALPFAFYLTQNIPNLTRSRRITILIIIALVFPFLGLYSGWAENIFINISESIWRYPPARPSDILAASILGFILIPLMCHFDTDRKSWFYPALFETAWRNALLSLSSIALVGAFWVVLFTGGMLMKSIGLDFIEDMIQKPIFAIPITGLVFGAAFALGLSRAEMMTTLRRFWLSITTWFLPLLMIFPVMWTIALPFTGLSLLFKTHSSAFILLWFLALCINFANAAYQDGESNQPYPDWLGKIITLSWLTLLVVAAAAWWAMALRIQQYGWTEDRVWGVFVLLIASLYVLGYAYSIRYNISSLTNVGNTNIFVSLVLCIGLLLLTSPLMDARRIAVNSQIERLIDRNLSSDKIDYQYFRWEAGQYGKEALEKLAAGISHKDRTNISIKAKQVLAQKERYSGETGVKALTPDEILQRIRVIPQDEKLDFALIEKLKSSNHEDWQINQCLDPDNQCTVWMIDLNTDNTKEAIFIVQRNRASSLDPFFYERQSDGKYKYTGRLNLPKNLNDKQHKEILMSIERGDVKAVTRTWRDIEVAGKLIQVDPE